MSLDRTNWGLANEHLFYNVTYVVYCEGRAENGVTHDEMFWKRVLASFDISCVCKSRGSKTDIIPLAQRAIEAQTENVIFAMDRDYGSYHGLPLTDRMVFYTYGYSWENDVLLSVDAGAVLSVFAACNENEAVEEELRSFLISSADCANRVTHMDIKNIRTTEALFDREKPVSIITGTGQGLRFDEALIIQNFDRLCQVVVVDEIDGERIHWLRDFYGNACAKIIYQWFVDRSHLIPSRSKIPFDAFLRICISTMKVDAESNERDAYYKSMTDAFVH